MQVKGQGFVHIPMIEELTAYDIIVNRANHGMPADQGLLFIVKLEIQGNHKAWLQFILTGNDILQPPLEIDL